MKKHDNTLTDKILLRLQSEDWNLRLEERIHEIQQHRKRVRFRLGTIFSIVVFSIITVAAVIVEDTASDSNIYASFEEASGGLEVQVSLTE